MRSSPRSLDMDTYRDDCRLFRKPVTPDESVNQQQLEVSGLWSGVDEDKGGGSVVRVGVFVRWKELPA